MLRLEAVKADITTLKVDAIVNAANSGLYPGAGVCGAIHRAAGHLLEEECRSIGGCATGDAVVSGAYEMQNAKAIIHAVGPIFDEDRERAPALLAATYRSIILQCRNNKFRSVAIPCISCGVYRFPPEQAAKIAVETVRKHVAEAPSLERVVFCCYLEEDFDFYTCLLGSAQCSS